MATNTTNITQRYYNSAIADLRRRPRKNYQLVYRLRQEQSGLTYWEGEAADISNAASRTEYCRRQVEQKQGVVAALLEVAAERGLLTPEGDLLPIFMATA